jgi:molybdenum cofactor cytidylyltransferase
MVIVVAGGNAERLRPVVDAAGEYLVVNLHPERGQFSSLQIGLQEVLNRGRDAAILTLVDRPAPSLETVRQLRAAFLDSPSDVWAVVPQYGGKHGHPLVAGREMITSFLRAPQESTARDIEHANQAHIRYVDVDDPLVVWNVDTPEEYERILAGCP